MKIFIGSSREATETLRLICVWLEELGFEPFPWDKPGMFPPGTNTLHQLLALSKQVIGALFIFSEDDKVWYRGDSSVQPRDNVLIEYGIFLGELGVNKAIIVKKGNPRNASDINGISYLDLKKVERARLELGIWATELKETYESNSKLTSENIKNGASLTFNDINVNLLVGEIQDLVDKGRDCSVVLPSNTFFVDDCISDGNSALGAFFNSKLPEFVDTFNQDIQILLEKQGYLKNNENRYQPSTTIILPVRYNTPSLTILTASTIKYEGSGFYTNLSIIADCIYNIFKITSDKRVSIITIPIIGSGHGGMEISDALNLMLLKIKYCSKKFNHIKKVNIIIRIEDTLKLKYECLNYFL